MLRGDPDYTDVRDCAPVAARAPAETTQRVCT
jgi:hypothetical protein